MKELYYDMIKPPHLVRLYEVRDSGGNMIIGDSKLCELSPPKVQLTSKKRRYFCGYKTCILARSLQASLNKWILIRIICFE